MKLIIRFISIIAIIILSYNNSFGQGFETLQDSTYKWKKIYSKDSALTINYYSKLITNENGESLYVGNDSYSKEGVLIESTRIDIEKNVVTQYLFYLDGTLNQITVRIKGGYCQKTTFWPNGVLEPFVQLNSNGEYEGWQFFYSQNGQVEEKQFFKNGLRYPELE